MIKYTDETLAIFVRRNRERNLDVERRMMINLLNALKGENRELKIERKREETAAV